MDAAADHPDQYWLRNMFVCCCIGTLICYFDDFGERIPAVNTFVPMLRRRSPILASCVVSYPSKLPALSYNTPSFTNNADDEEDSK